MCSALKHGVSSYQAWPTHENFTPVSREKLCNIKNNILHYSYHPKAAIETDAAQLYWDQLIVTDQTIVNNRPDIVVKDKGKEEVSIIDVSHPLDHNLQKTFTKKLRKYEEFSEEIRDMWQMSKIRILPIAISCNGIISKDHIIKLSKHDIPIYVLLRSMQRNVILESCRIVRKITNVVKWIRICEISHILFNPLEIL